MKPVNLKATIEHRSGSIEVDLARPLDISMPLQAGEGNARAWYVDPLTIEPVRSEYFTGSVKEGGSVNFRNIFFNPHGHGTHTECVGHISKEDYSINKSLKQFFFLAEVVSITPEKKENGDQVITEELLREKIRFDNTEALVIRTLPNSDEKLNRNYSGTNPPYMEAEAIEFILGRNIDHLLIDTPSVDREEDEGKLLAHHIFWNYPNSPATDRTITEMIFVPDEVMDGRYLLNLQIASFENDASPSKPLLFEIAT